MVPPVTLNSVKNLGSTNHNAWNFTGPAGMVKMRSTFVAIAMLAATPALAQDTDFVDSKEVAEAMAKKDLADGWNFGLSLALNISLSHSSQVVGQVDGATIQLGGVIEGIGDYRVGTHEWTNRLTIKHAQTSTPQIDQFVKTADLLELRSMYLYGIPSMPWLGPFARLRAQTTLAPGHLIWAEGTTINAVGADNQPQFIEPSTKLRVTEPFEPLILRESAGLFMRPIESEAIKLTITVGGGAQQVITSGEGWILINADTFELQRLEDSSQIGAEVEADATGKLNEQVTWTATANLLYPFYADPNNNDLSGLDLLTSELSGKVTIKLSEWAALDYVLSAVRQPLILEEWQVQSGILLTSSFNLL